MIEDIVCAIWEFLVQSFWFRCCAATTVIGVTVSFGSWSHWGTWAIVAVAFAFSGLPYLLVRHALRGRR